MVPGMHVCRHTRRFAHLQDLASTLLTVIQGATINGASPAYTVDEMAYALKVAKTKILITLPGSLDKALAAAKQVGIPITNVLLIQGIADGFKSVQDLIRQQNNIPAPPPYQIPEGSTNKDLCGYLNFSSGTTGLPKAVSSSTLSLFHTEQDRL